MSACHPIECYSFRDNQGVEHKMLCPKHMQEFIESAVPKPDPKRVHDCVVDKVFESVEKDFDCSLHPGFQPKPSGREEALVKSIIRHTLNMALEICK